LIIAPLMVFFNDIYEIYTVLLTVMNYFTPVFYPAKDLPVWVRHLEQFNPLFLFMDTARDAVGVSGTLVTPNERVAAALMAVGMCVIGWLFFARSEGKFAYHF
jgi:ABC-type polysaccharide/polyol phosphate export permease